MLKIVTSPEQACENIIRFADELKTNAEMQARLSYARSWYACRDESGAWRFAPAKYVGYQDIDAQTYLECDEAGDGRRVEAQLRMFSHAAEPATPLHAELTAALIAFLARYGKTPSMKVQLKIMKGRRNAIDAASPPAPHDAIVDLMVAVSRTLPTEQLQSLLAGLSGRPLAAEGFTSSKQADQSQAEQNRVVRRG